MTYGKATLIHDGGASATSSNFFRSASYFEAEGVTHTLVLETNNGLCALPLVVRKIAESGLLDAISPYGYPGGELAGEPPDHRRIDMSGLGLVSIFVRDSLGRPTLSGGTRRGRVFTHDPLQPRHASKSFRRDTRRNLREGYTVELVRGADVDEAGLSGLLMAYLQTMDQVQAAGRYRFSREYLRRCLDFCRTWLALVRSTDGNVAAGELAVESDGHLHSFLAGTCSRHRQASAGKNATLRLLDLADELKLQLNHGGGWTENDGVAASKRSYCNAEEWFVTHELICDNAQFERLSISTRDCDFFPPYRCPDRTG